MDPQIDLPDLVEDLEVNIDELSTVLSPLLTSPLSTTASSLPLLDKAKLYVLAAYSVESLLYSTLQASGVNAKEHAIFRELARLKGYFGKIKEVEERAAAPTAPRPKVDVAAAARFIRHGLSGNGKYDLERAERMAREKAKAHLKAVQMHKRFDEEGEEIKDTLTPKKRDVEEMETEQEADAEILGGLEEPEDDERTEPAKKRTRLSVAAGSMDIDSAPSPTTSTPESKKKRNEKGRKKSKSTETSEAETPEYMQVEDPAPVEERELGAEELAEPTKEKRRKRGTRNKSTETSEMEGGDVVQDNALSGTELQQAEADLSAEPRKKKHKDHGKKTSKPAETSEADTPATNDQEEMDMNIEADSPAEQEKQRGRRGKRPKRKNSNMTTSNADDQDGALPAPEAEPSPSAKKKRKQRGQKGTLSSGITDEDGAEQAEEETIFPTTAPKTRSETFNALLDGSLPEKAKKSKSKAKDKGKGK
jgi:exosome complex protein LRP1